VSRLLEALSTLFESEGLDARGPLRLTEGGSARPGVAWSLNVYAADGERSDRIPAFREDQVSGIRIETQGRLAILRLDKARGNAIDEPFVAEMTGAVAEVAKNEAARGVLLASAHPKLFCPGLDLVALVEYDRAALERFMKAFGEMTFALFALPKPVVAALNGHAVAGGCVIALTADHRVLRRGAQIGLNEVRVGVPLPWSVSLLLRASVPPGSLSRVALLGSNFTDEEAVSLGLVHEVREAEGFEAVCLARLDEFADKDPRAVSTTKSYLRASVLAEMRSEEDARRGDFLDAWFSPEGRERIRGIVDSLAKK
jgi:enoyl-CoA hydratase/carnithine racemase